MDLSNRERSILQSLIHYFILDANPVGSTQIARQKNIGIKSASVRRVMAALEEKGLLYQPHTSAGRVPTTSGYRYYVDEILHYHSIDSLTENLIVEAVDSYDGDVDLMLQQVSYVLAHISKQLGIIVTPHFYQGVFEHLEIVRVSSDKLMLVLSVKGGQVKTIFVELKQKLESDALKNVVKLLNRRLYGKSLKDIKDNFGALVADIEADKTGLIRLFSESAETLFDFTKYDNYALTGASNILNQPEFSEAKNFSTLIELLEDKNIVIHFMEQREFPPGTKITIGEEHKREAIKECSVITSTYNAGDVSGVLGIIGPTRMAYGKVIPLVEFTAKTISKKLNSSK